MRAKFDVPTISRSKKSKNRSRDPSSTPFDLVLHFSLVPLMVTIRLPNLIFLVSTVAEIWRMSQNSESRSRDRSPTPFDLILPFLVSALMIIMLAKFEVCSFNRSRYMEGVPKF